MSEDSEEQKAKEMVTCEDEESKDAEESTAASSCNINKY